MAENRSLAQALSTYRPGPAGAEALERELDRLVGQFAVDALLLVDPTDHVIASAGPRRAAFPPDQPLHGGPASPAQRRFDEIIVRPSARFRASGLELTGLNPAVGYAYLATAIDDGYAASLASQLRTSVTVMCSTPL